VPRPAGRRGDPASHRRPDELLELVGHPFGRRDEVDRSEQRRRDPAGLVDLPPVTEPTHVALEEAGCALDGPGQLVGGLVLVGAVGQQDRVPLHHVGDGEEDLLGLGQPGPHGGPAVGAELLYRGNRLLAGPRVHSHHLGRPEGGIDQRPHVVARNDREPRAVGDLVEGDGRGIPALHDAVGAHRAGRVDDEDLGRLAAAGAATDAGLSGAGAGHSHDGVDVGAAVRQELVLEEVEVNWAMPVPLSRGAECPR
jgi:hypothetical protein